MKTWHYAGHASQIPDHGDYMLFEIAAESVIVIRQKSGDVHALLNVCRHRGSQVCRESSGNVKKIVCPYHAWAYDIDGKLTSTRSAEGEIDKREYGLKKIQARVLHGLIFINFDESAISFDPIERDLDGPLTPYGLAHAKVAHEASYPIAANWKLAVENYCECYHCRPAHPEYSRAHSLAVVEEKHQALWDGVKACAESIGLTTESIVRSYTDAGGLGNDRMYEHYPLLDGYETGSQDGKLVAPLLGELKRSGSIASDFQIGSLAFFLAYTDHVVSYRFVPVSPLETRCDISWIVNADAEEGRDYDLNALTWLWDVTTIADKRIIEDNQKGINSRFYAPGPYTKMEEPTMQFIEWYLDCIR
jgi:Rieske 2Fe-2S family protein